MKHSRRILPFLFPEEHLLFLLHSLGTNTVGAFQFKGAGEIYDCAVTLTNQRQETGKV